MAAEERHGAASLPMPAPSAASKTEGYRYSASSYTTKSNEGMCVREEEKKKHGLWRNGRVWLTGYAYMLLRSVGHMCLPQPQQGVRNGVACDDKLTCTSHK